MGRESLPRLQKFPPIFLKRGMGLGLGDVTCSRFDQLQKRYLFKESRKLVMDTSALSDLSRYRRFSTAAIGSLSLPRKPQTGEQAHVYGVIRVI